MTIRSTSHRLARTIARATGAVGAAVALTGTVSAAALPKVPVASPCTMRPADRVWIEAALARWRVAERRYLLLDASPWPTIVTADATCVYTSRPRAGGRTVWNGVRHDGSVSFPDGKVQPIGPISFAAGDNGAKVYFAMSLPSVWQAAGVKSSFGVAGLIDGVMLHELMHTRQAYFANPEMARLTKRFGLSDDVGDDTIQDRYQANAAYIADYQAERDLLFAAAAAPTNRGARALAARALERLRTRRETWFTGASSRWTPIDNLFLTMEGLGQWLAYRWYTDPAGGRLSPAVVLPEVRRGGTYWTQDEGLALFLTVDRLLPNWQKLAFAAKPALAEELLERAIRARAPDDVRKRTPEASFIAVKVRPRLQPARK